VGARLPAEPAIRERDKRPSFTVVVRGLAFIHGTLGWIGTAGRIDFNRSLSVSPASHKDFAHHVGASQEEAALQVFHHGSSSFCYSIFFIAAAFDSALMITMTPSDDTTAIGLSQSVDT
jgi:hypothetical protein